MPDDPTPDQTWHYTAACDPEALDLPQWTLPGGPLSPEVQAILVTRGYTDQDAVTGFLSLEHYTPTLPDQLPNLERAVRLLDGLQTGATVLVWGDFDVDGQTATAILVEGLAGLGLNVPFHLPGRGQSHGVQPEKLAQLLAEHQPDLLLICDTGSDANAAVARVKAQDIPVIIADHHELKAPLPPADALVNPQLLPRRDHPLATLSAAGVAYLLVEALYHARGIKARAERFLDLAALGLIADVVPQVADTRYLIQRGLHVLRHTERAGLQALAGQLNLTVPYLTSQDVAFSLAPALNALGRLGDPGQGVALLTTDDTVTAQQLAAVADGLNQQRRLQTNQTVEAAEVQLVATPALLEEWEALVLHSPTWPGNILGAAAARLAEKYHKPVALVAEDEASGLARGSVRSLVGYPVAEALAQLDDFLLSYGGHEGAGGFSLPLDELPKLRRLLSKAFAATRTAEIPPAVTVEGILPLERLTLDFGLEIQQLEPFGAGNPLPVFVTRDLNLRSAAKLGRHDLHRRLIVENRDGQRQHVFWWHSAELEPPAGRFDLAYTISISAFQGERQLQVQLVDWQDIPPDEDEQPLDISVIDYRQTRTDLAQLLDEIHARDPEALVWAEGFPARQAPGLPLGALSAAAALVILSAPPSGERLVQALETVRPQRVYLVAAPPPVATLPEFLKLLRGLSETIITAEGTVNIERLVERTAQTRTVVRLGLDYLQALGVIQVEFGARTRVEIGPGDGQPDEGAAAALQKRLQAAWEEVAAYRRYLHRVDAQQLIAHLTG